MGQYFDFEIFSDLDTATLYLFYINQTKYYFTFYTIKNQMSTFHGTYSPFHFFPYLSYFCNPKKSHNRFTGERKLQMEQQKEGITQSLI